MEGGYMASGIYTEIKKDWDNEVGDRITKLVFIGKDMDKEKIIDELDKCLD